MMHHMTQIFMQEICTREYFGSFLLIKYWWTRLDIKIVWSYKWFNTFPNDKFVSNQGYKTEDALFSSKIFS